MENLQELAMDFMSRNDHNFFASNIVIVIFIGKQAVNVESIWYNDNEDKIYIHCGCKEFEGDLDIDSLSEENQNILKRAFIDNI